MELSEKDADQLGYDKTYDNNTRKYQYRKIQPILGGISFCVVLPKQYAIGIGLAKGDYVKVRQQENAIIIEKA
jgi:Antidote-toxin recognition MazE, bacterial antitoxin